VKGRTKLDRRQLCQSFVVVILLALCLEGYSLASGNGWLSQLNLYPDHAHHGNTIAIYTDKGSYSAGETMQVGLDMTTASSTMAGSYRLLILLRMRNVMRTVVDLPNLPLPPGWRYSNPDVFTWTLPSLRPGTYAWIGVLIPAGEDPAVDTAIWTFTGSASEQRVVSVEKALEQLGEVDLDLGR